MNDMVIDILTLFPSFFDSPVSTGVIDGAIENKKISLNIVNMREYGEGSYKKCDDTPYGGGPGMVMTASIFEKYFNSNKKGYTILFSPTGSPLNQEKVKELSLKDHITLILGHYEGIDARVEKLYTDEIISIGDYVLSGGEIPALTLLDAISRYKGVLGNEDSVINDTFEEMSAGLLEYEQYTKPRNVQGLEVPEVLLDGNHKVIDKYRRAISIIRTFKFRSDLFSEVNLTKEDIKVIFEYLINKTDL